MLDLRHILHMFALARMSALIMGDKARREGQRSVSRYPLGLIKCLVGEKMVA